MKKLFFAALLSAVFPAAVSAAEPEFSLLVIPTKAVNLEDQFAGILPNRPPHLPKVGRVVCGEPFEIAIVFRGAKSRNGAVELAGKIILTDPRGGKKELPIKGNLANISGDAAGVFLFPQKLRVIYEKKDPKGRYSFEAELTDGGSGKTAKASSAVEYVEKRDPEPGVKAFGKTAAYYREQDPAYIIPAFREFLQNLPKQKAREKNNFNPMPQLAFFYFLLKENPQCVPAFSDLFKQLRGEEKYMAAVVLNFVSEEAKKVLNTNQRKAVGQQFRTDPFRIEKVAAAWQLDVCWAEFFVRGTKAPLMKIIAALSLASDALTIDAYKKLAQPTKEDRRKLLNGLTVMAAQWSLASLVKTHPLIRYYTEAALVRGEVKDPIAAALAAKSVGMKIKLEKSSKP